MTDDADNLPEVPRDNAGRFVAGHGSANPGGKTKKWREARKLIDERLAELIETCVFMAQHGSEAHMRLLLDRAMPTLKPMAEPLVIEGLAEAEPGDRVDVVMRAVGAGELSADDASKLLTALAGAEDVQDSLVLRARLQSAEQNRDLL